jgi:hypothetical protein
VRYWITGDVGVGGDGLRSNEGLRREDCLYRGGGGFVVGVVLNGAGKENSGAGYFLTSPVLAGLDGFCSFLKVFGALEAR